MASFEEKEMPNFSVFCDTINVNVQSVEAINNGTYEEEEEWYRLPTLFDIDYLFKEKFKIIDFSSMDLTNQDLEILYNYLYKNENKDITIYICDNQIDVDKITKDCSFLKKLLNLEHIEKVIIYGNPIVDYNNATFFNNLTINQISKLIFVHSEWLPYYPWEYLFENQELQKESKKANSRFWFGN